MRRRPFLCLGLGAVLCGCRGTATEVPLVSPDAAAAAAAEIGTAPPPLRRQMAEGEATRTIRRIADRLGPPARELCIQLGVGTCDWYIAASRSRQMNAYAGEDGRVVINRGILEYARSDDEVAFVMAHELAHHAANHVRATGDDMSVGAVAGALFGGLLVGATAASGGVGPRTAGRTVDNWSAIGAGTARLAFSKDQEREADRLGLLILHRAGYDPGLARNFVLTLARAEARRDRGLLDLGWLRTHPAGPERLAAFDATLAELRAGGGQIPLRAG
jgi:Zn-dependent protease with chaperone function